MGERELLHIGVHQLLTKNLEIICCARLSFLNLLDINVLKIMK
jgi:hypothetical protein